MKRQFCLILPDIRSCHNVGAMFRTADAFGVTKIFLVGYTSCPPKPQIDKVSLGAETWVPWEQRKDLKRLINSLKKKGVFVVGLEKTKTSEDIGILDIKDIKDIALIVGNEVDGISEDILRLCDNVVHIPMHGRKESLNVSIAAGIAMYEIKKLL
ncbi:MAG TPA: RNA methyltransferase [Candidatus Magasanikbacteria bacterium]|nr:RNA methyltransferase [Candidatus Magasanikbacteria bacterium]